MRRMYLLTMTAVALAMFGVAGSDMAQGSGGHCTVQDRLRLDQAGYSHAEVKDLCGRTSNQVPAAEPWAILSGEGQPRWVQWCVTSQGRCSLNPATSGYYAPGAPCNCYMPWGFYEGMVQ